MRYMLQVRFGDAGAAIAALSEEQRQEVFAEFEAVRGLTGVVEGNQLQPVSTAATVRVDSGEVQVDAGPACDAAAALDGYYLCEAPDADAAIAVAASIPVARLGGTVEVRPLFAR